MLEKIFFTVCFSAIAGYAAIEDYKYRNIPVITYPLFIALGILKLIVQGFTMQNILAAIFGMLLGGLLPLVIAIITEKIGGGDIKLIVSAGFYLWLADSRAILFFSHLNMAIYGIIYAKIKKKKLNEVAMPYDPFYAVTGIAICIVSCFV